MMLFMYGRNLSFPARGGVERGVRDNGQDVFEDFESGYIFHLPALPPSLPS